MNLHPLPKRMSLVTSNLSGAPHGVGECREILSWEIRTRLRRFTASCPPVADLTLGSTLFGGTNCAHVALGITGEVDRGIVVSVVSAAAGRAGPDPVRN